MPKLKELVIATANKYERVTSVEQALDLLQKQKALAGVDRWKDDLTNKEKAAGGVAGRLVIWLASALQ
jgi:hypothetical protein